MPVIPFPRRHRYFNPTQIDRQQTAKGFTVPKLVVLSLSTVKGPPRSAGAVATATGGDSEGTKITIPTQMMIIITIKKNNNNNNNNTIHCV